MDTSLSNNNWNNKNNTHFSHNCTSNNISKYEFDIPSEIKCQKYKNNMANAYYFGEDDDSMPFDYDIDDITFLTEQCSQSDNSAGYASDETLDVYEVYDDEILFNYRGPKVLPINETPVTICTVNTIGCLRSRKLLRVLFDSGSMGCLIKRSALPKGVIPQELSKIKSFNTLAGKLSAYEKVVLRDVRLPEFDKNRRISEQRALIFDSDTCKYDVILGTDFLSKAGIKLDYESGNMEWYDSILPMRPRSGLTSEDFDAMEDQYFIQLEDELLGDDWLQCFATEILDAKYDFTDVKDVVKTITHLNPQQRADILAVLQKHQKMFDGSLGVYPHKKFYIEIDPNAKPVYARPYAVPRIHLSVFKKELDHLVEIGVLKHQQESEWASPTFITPKKDGRVRWVSDLRQLNKVVNSNTGSGAYMRHHFY